MVKRNANCSKRRGRQHNFSSPLALGLLSTIPAAKDPVEAILWHAESLVIESGVTDPPFPPSIYAPLRNVKEIVYRDMEVDGRLLPHKDGFVIELREDRPQERKNFTCAHELAHTFFYESVPSIKYRNVVSSESHHDPEEEMLCNIAAAELLMPSRYFSQIVREYPSSPESLQHIAQLFQTSLTATIVHIQKLGLWDSTFIMWQSNGDEIIAKWIATPKRGLIYLPNLKITDQASSGICHTLNTGEATRGVEWLSFEGISNECNTHSVRLNKSRNVLSSFESQISQKASRRYNRQAKILMPLPALPLVYNCECNGTLWRYVTREGRTYVVKCRATKHQRLSS